MCYNGLYFGQGFLSGLVFVLCLFILSIVLKWFILFMKELVDYWKTKRLIQKNLKKRYTVIIVDGKIVKIFEEEDNIK